MTITVANLDYGTSTWGDAFTRIDVLAHALTNYIVTVDQTPTTGNVEIIGSIFASQLATDTISGGSNGTPGVLTFDTALAVTNTAAFFANVSFSGANVSLGAVANVNITGSSATNYVLAANNTTNRLMFVYMPPFNSTPPGDGNLLTWSTNQWISSNALHIDISTGDISSARDIIIGRGLSANGAFGTAGQFLTSDGTGAYWSTVPSPSLASVTAVGATTTTQITANNIVTTGANSNFNSGLLFIDTVNNRIGIGTTSPAATIHVAGNLNVTGSANSNFNSGLLFIDTVNNRIGIGTTSPAVDLAVNGTIRGTNVQVGTNDVWHMGNDGAGSGLDADLLDGQQGTSFVRTNNDTTLAAGYVTTALNDGNITSGTYTPSPIGGNMRRIGNAGNFTFAAPNVAGDYSLVVQITNSGSSGTITPSGFTSVTGDLFTSTSSHRFIVWITKINNFTHMHVIQVV